MKKIITAIFILIILVINRNEVTKYLGIGVNEKQATSVAIEEPKDALEIEKPKEDYFVNDSLYRWNNIHLSWETVKSSRKELEQAPMPTLASLSFDKSNKKTVVIDWELLMDIQYKLKYYEVLEMEIYTPVFTEALKALDGKKVIIEGFVIPIDESGDFLALSANPYASCFFCGKASPASVISMYLKKKKFFKMDDYRKFRGVLKLNYDDPEEYYYILKDAVAIK